MPTTNQTTKQTLTGLFAGLLILASAASPGWKAGATVSSGALQTTSRSDDEILQEPPSEVRLAWEGLADDGRVLETRGSSLMLRVENTSATPQHLRLVINADDGALADRKLDYGAVRLAPFGNQTVAVDVRRFGVQINNLLFSGRLHATAHSLGEAGERGEANISQPAFFHPTSAPVPGGPDVAALAFYGKKALRERFNSGDYRGVARELTGDPDNAGLTRVLFSGAGNTTADTLRQETQQVAQDEGDGRRSHSSNGAPNNAPANNAPANNALGGLQAQPAVAAAAKKYRTCVLFRSQTIDSGIPIANGPNAGGLEDYRINWNDGVDVPAYGVRVKLTRGNWSQTFDTERDTGCFNWSHNDSGQFLLKVYAYSTGLTGNYIRVHNDPNDFSEYPGTTYNRTHYITPTPGGLNYYAYGSYDSEWTAMAALNFSLYRLNIGTSNKAFHVAMDNAPDDGGWSSAHWGESNSYITAGRHYIKLDNFDETSSKLQSQRKFVVSHELGHAYAAIYYGAHADAQNGGEVNVSLSHNVDPNACGTSDDPDNNEYGYSIRSKEWGAVGFREGFAHFVAAIVWNNHNTEGSFHWLGSHHDLERHGDGVGVVSGGRLKNVCCTAGDGDCTDSYQGAATVEDWMLFFWDWYTNVDAQCGNHPTRTDMLRLYRDTRLRSGLQKDNYFTNMREAAKDLSLPTCLKTTRFDQYAIHNGINN